MADIEAELTRLNKQYAVVCWNSQTLIMREKFKTNETFKAEERRLISFQSKDGFLLWNENNIVWQKESDSEKVKKIKVAKAWLEWKNRRQFENLVFEPNGEKEEGVHNLWTGFSYQPIENKGKFDIFLDHLRVNVCNEDESLYAWLLAWCADLVQKPQRKLGTSLVLRGRMGVGKGIVAYHLGALMSRHYFAVMRAEHVTGRFNGHLADTLLLFLDEAFWAGDKTAEGTLKSLVSEDSIPIELKGKDLYRIKSYLRLVISTNNDWAVPTGMSDERRFAIFDVGERCMQDKPYFEAMQKQLSNGGYEALLYFLMHYEYDTALPARIPVTSGLLDQKLHALPPEIRWWLNCLSDETIGDQDGWQLISRGIFYNAYSAFANQTKIRHPLDKKALARAIQKKCLFKQKKDRQAIGHWDYVLLPLKECRENFERMIGHRLSWDGE